MRPSAVAAFNSFTDKLEGHLSYPYLDVLGLVTVGRGNLIDPLSLSLPLPWAHADGSPASQADVETDWHRVKSLQNLRTQGGRAYANGAQLFLSEDAINALCMKMLDGIDAYMVKRFPEFEAWPSDAQLGVCSMAWAMGSGFRYPHFDAAALAQDFDECASQCTIGEQGNAGVIPRNVANRTLFANAAQVIAQGLDPSALYYPAKLAPPS